MRTIKARLYGNSNRQGKCKSFEIVESLPEVGENVYSGNDSLVWGTAEHAHLDPEQRHKDEDKMWAYDFYEVPIIDNIIDREVVETRYYAIEAVVCD